LCQFFVDYRSGTPPTSTDPAHIIDFLALFVKPILKLAVHSKVTENVSGYVASAWTTDKDGIRSRTCTYTMALNHAMAPKSCVVTEKQVISHFGRNGDGFIVNKETQNSGVPYANDFTIQCTYCISKVSDHEARIKVHGGIVYKKNIWSVVRGYIEKSTYQGLDDHYSALEDTLRDECERKAMRPETQEPQPIDRFDEERERQRSRLHAVFSAIAD
ncbi:hypothetical protein ANCCEY_04267, partial [Ancylostoma ceylanicum]